jgi:hypothetical protein
LTSKTASTPTTREENYKDHVEEKENVVDGYCCR